MQTSFFMFRMAPKDIQITSHRLFLFIDEELSFDSEFIEAVTQFNRAVDSKFMFSFRHVKLPMYST